MNAHSIKGMNGILPIKTGFKAAYQSFSVVGGPYDSFPGRRLSTSGMIFSFSGQAR